MESIASPTSFHLTPTAVRQLNPRKIHVSSSVNKSNNLSFSSSTSGTLHSYRQLPFVQTAAIRHVTGSLIKGEGLRFAIVVARFNELVTKLLLEGAIEAFKRHSVRDEDIEVVWVPGSFEIGGVMYRRCGDTTHYDAVANSAASGVLSAGINSGVPCIFGVLTCEDMDQALNRSGGKAGNKGAETALTALEMASLFEHHLN